MVNWLLITLSSSYDYECHLFVISRVPPEFNRFVLVDDDGSLLATGIATSGRVPHISERTMNYRTVVGSKYAREADRLAADSSAGHKDG